MQRAVQAAARQGLTIKAVGAGHSFTGIAVAEGVQLLLGRLSGVVAVDEASARVTLAAGTPLRRLPRLLAPFGLALQNMGDIDRQSIAGATSTGTHGTGGAFGGLATQIVAVTHQWGRYYTERVRAVQSGTWKSGNLWGGVREGLIRVGDFGPKVPAAVQQEVLAAQKAIASRSGTP